MGVRDSVRIGLQDEAAAGQAPGLPLIAPGDAGSRRCGMPVLPAEGE
jgi:hypothetical protein